MSRKRDPVVDAMISVFVAFFVLFALGSCVADLVSGL